MSRRATGGRRRERDGGGGRPARLVSTERAARISYRDPDSLRQLLSPRGLIRSRSQTGLSRPDQVRLAREVKRARELAFLPYAMDREQQLRGR